MPFIYFPGGSGSGITVQQATEISNASVKANISESYEAGENLIANSAIFINTIDNKAYQKKSSEADHKIKSGGFVREATNLGEVVDVYFSGEVATSTIFAGGQKVFVGSNGELVFDPTILDDDNDIKYYQVIGWSLKNNKISIDFQTAVWK